MLFYRFNKILFEKSPRVTDLSSFASLMDSGGQQWTALNKSTKIAEDQKLPHEFLTGDERLCRVFIPCL